MITVIANDYHVNAVSGVLSHNLEKGMIDGKNIIATREEPDNKVNKVVFAPNQVYALDIVLSTGEGKPKPTEDRVSVFKRDPSVAISLKVASARQFLSEVDQKASTFPFGIRSIDSKIAKIGSLECLQKGLITPYPTIAEKKGAIVAQFKYTVAILPTGKLQIFTGLPLESIYKPEYSITNEQYSRLSTSPIARKK